ncbi:hypothetical protein F5Y18DRAFT_402195 [Xylariaceae sp. FL1019]|nr:hypothetical protein F5Y18DRAFT_402195 [Xylariaceae sp. FL1019]
MNLELRFNHYPACEIQIVQFGFSSNPLDIRSEYLSLAEKFDSLINSASLLSEFRCEPTPLSLPWELGQKQEQRVVPRSTTSRDGLKSDMEIDNYWARPAENVINRSAMLSEFMTPRQQDFSQISFFEPDFLSSESLRNDFGHTTIPSHETRESSLTIPYIAANFPTSATDSNVFAASKDKAHHSKQSWEDVRSTIEKLYREDGLSLAQVKNTMDNRGFIATEREYYPRLKRWGLTKNIRSEEMIVMYRKMIQRKAAEDKETKITLHGRPVDLRKISRFVKRVQLSPSQLPGQGTPVHILAFTPRSRSNHSSITFPWNQSPHKRFLQIARSNLAETASEEGSSKGGGSEDGDDLYDLSWLENMDIWRP